MALNHLDVLKNYAEEYVFSYRKFIALKEIKKQRELASAEERELGVAKTKISAIAGRISGLHVPSKELVNALHSAVVKVNSTKLEASGIHARKVTIGEVVRSITQFINMDDLLNNDQRLRSLSIEAVKAYHKANIMAKQISFYGGTDEYLKEEDKFNNCADALVDEYINPALIEQSLKRATGYYNGEVLGELEPHVDANRLSSMVLGLPDEDFSGRNC